MHLEEFAEGKSIIHSLDPRIKLIAVFPFIMVIAVARGFPVAFTGLIAGLILVLLSRLDFKALLKRLLAVNIFILFLWLILPFSVKGKALFSVGPLVASYEGLSYVLIITLKANAIVLSTIALVATIPVFKLVHALRHLKVPEKLVNLFFFCYRYISVLHEDYSALYGAMKARAFKSRTSLHTYRSFAYLVGMLILKSYEHSQKIYQAMLCRGFRGKFLLLEHFGRLTKRDYIFLGSLLLFTIFLIVVEVSA